MSLPSNDFDLDGQPETGIRTEVTTLADRARAFQVKTREQAEEASGFLAAVRGLKAKVTATFAPLKKKASDAHKAIVAEEKKNLAPLDEAERAVKERIGGFLEAERRRQEEAERKRREEEARLERERRAADEAARKAAEDERLREAEKLERQGKSAEAEKLIEAPIPAPAPTPKPYVPPPPPPRKVEGVATRETFSAKVTSVAELAAHVAANPALAHLLVPNLFELHRMARGVRTDGAPVCPGVVCVASREVVAR